jgi:hypothetical protein
MGDATKVVVESCVPAHERNVVFPEFADEITQLKNHIHPNLLVPPRGLVLTKVVPHWGKVPTTTA